MGNTDVIATTPLTAFMAVGIEYEHVIKSLRQNKCYGAKQLLKMFHNKGWTLEGLKKLIYKIDATGSFARQPGSSRPQTAHTDSHIQQVEELTLSQEDAPRTHSREIARQVGISVASVNTCYQKRSAP